MRGLLGLAMAVGLVGALVVSVGCSAPTPQREVDRFFERFNDNMPQVLAEHRRRILAERTNWLVREQAAAQRGEGDAAHEAREQLKLVEARLRMLESLTPRSLHLTHRKLHVTELEWPEDAVQVSVFVDGQTLKDSEQQLEVKPIDEEHSRWVFTLRKHEQGHWVIVDQRLASMRPYEHELRASLAGSVRTTEPTHTPSESAVPGEPGEPGGEEHATSPEAQTPSEPEPQGVPETPASGASGVDGTHE